MCTECWIRWWTGPWQHCSVTCGDDGLHKRSVMCVRSLGEDEQIALEDSACRALRKPVSVEPCKTKEPCPGTVPIWMTGNWSQVRFFFTVLSYISIPLPVRARCGSKTRIPVLPLL